MFIRIMYINELVLSLQYLMKKQPKTDSLSSSSLLILMIKVKDNLIEEDVMCVVITSVD